MPPQLVYFDLGRVLVDFEITRLFGQVAAVSGVEPDWIRHWFLDSGFSRQLETGLATEQEFYEKFCRETGTAVEYHTIQNAVNDIFELNLSILPLVSALKAARIRIGILSNTFGGHWEYIKNRYSGLISMFDCTTLSYEVHAMKPAPEIYYRAAEKAGVPLSRLFFTDDLQENVLGAQAVGMDAVVFRDVKQLADDLRERGLRFSL